jgi:hypothetical protein
MKRIIESDEADQFPAEMVTVFARAVNYPRDPAAVQFLAQGLVRASKITGVSMKAIIERCTETSDRCPTDFELLEAAKGIRGTGESGEEWKRPVGCSACQDSGWRHLERQVSPKGVAPYTAEYSTHCDCSLGRALAAAEATRKAEKAAKR